MCSQEVRCVVIVHQLKLDPLWLDLSNTHTHTKHGWSVPSASSCETCWDWAEQRQSHMYAVASWQQQGWADMGETEYRLIAVGWPVPHKRILTLSFDPPQRPPLFIPVSELQSKQVQTSHWRCWIIFDWSSSHHGHLRVNNLHDDLCLKKCVRQLGVLQQHVACLVRVVLDA